MQGMKGVCKLVNHILPGEDQFKGVSQLRLLSGPPDLQSLLVHVNSDKIHSFTCLVHCFDALRPRFFNYVRKISCLPWLNQQYAVDDVSCSRTPHCYSASSEP